MALYRRKISLAVAVAGLTALVVGSTAVAAKTAVRGTPASSAAAGKQLPSASPLSSSATPSGYLLVSSGSLTAPTGAETFGSVACPATRRGVARQPQSGGVFITSGSLAANINNSYPSGTSWVGFVNNSSGADTTFEVWAVCAKPHSAYTQAVSASFANPAGSQNLGSVSCPAGTKVLGGGASSPTIDLAQNINESVPFHSGRIYGWSVFMNNSGGNADSFNVYAVCSKYSPTNNGYTIVEGASVSDPPGTQTFSSVGCPAGDSVLGGGQSNDSISTATSLNSNWPSSTTGWGAWENNGSGSTVSDNAWAICAF